MEMYIVWWSSFYTLTHSRTNVRIYSYKQIWHKRMSEYIRKRKIDTNECPNIYSWPIYSNIFVKLWLAPATSRHFVITADICLEMTDNKNILLTYMYSLILISCWHICTHCEISIEVPWLKLKDSWVPKWLKQIIVKASLVISPFLILNFLIRTPQQIVNSWWFARLCQWHMSTLSTSDFM